MFADVPDPQPVAAIVLTIPDPQPCAAPVVAATIFPAKHAGHNCPNCGYERRETPVSYFIPGGHVHTCPQCRTAWWH